MDDLGFRVCWLSNLEFAARLRKVPAVTWRLGSYVASHLFCIAHEATPHDAHPQRSRGFEATPKPTQTGRSGALNTHERKIHSQTLNPKPCASASVEILNPDAGLVVAK